VEPFFSGVIKRGLQILAFLAPGESSLRVWLHRLRGVRIGTESRIGMGTLIETSFPEWISIGNHVTLGMRTTIIAHMVGLPPRQHGKNILPFESKTMRSWALELSYFLTSPLGGGRWLWPAAW